MSGRIDAFNLLDFDVQLTMSEINNVNFTVLTEITEDWLAEVIPAVVDTVIFGCTSNFTLVAIQRILAKLHFSLKHIPA